MGCEQTPVWVLETRSWFSGFVSWYVWRCVRISLFHRVATMLYNTPTMEGWIWGEEHFPACKLRGSKQDGIRKPLQD